MTRHALAIALVLLALAGSAGAVRAELTVDWPPRGQAFLKNFVYLEDRPGEGRYHGEAVVRVEGSARADDWGRFRLVLEGREDDDDYVDGIAFRVPETNTRRSAIDLKEAVAAFRWQTGELSAGKQIFTWGSGEVFNPTDLVNPHDYLDPVDSEKLGVYSVAAQITAGPAMFRLVVVPAFTPSRIPSRDSRWFPQPAALAGPAIVKDRELPDVEPGNMEYAVRVQTTVRGWDLAATYYEGFESTPVLRRSLREVAPGVSIPVLTPVFTRMRVAGLDAATTFGKLEVHGEAAAKFAVRNGATDRLQAVAGLRYTWDDLDLTWLERITLVAEYAREVVLSRDRGSSIVDDGRLALPNNGFRDSVIARAIFKFTEETEFRLTGIVDFAGGATGLAQPRLVHKITDAFHIEAGVDLLGGARDTFWGRWRQNNRGFLILRYFF